MAIVLSGGAILTVNAANDFKATALLWSARDGNKARLLVEHGADVNAQSKQGQGPAQSAPQPRTAVPRVGRHSVRWPKLPAASHRGWYGKVQRQDDQANLAPHALREDACG